MLTLRREALGMTQTELAERWGVTQAFVSRVEADLLALPADKLDPLAEQLGVPAAFFLETAEIHGYGSPCFYHRKRKSIPVPKLRSIQARVNILRIQTAKLLAGIEIGSPQRFAPMDIEEHGSPEKVARLVRASWGLPMGPVQNLVGAIESNGGIVVMTDFGTTQLDAVSQWTAGLPPLLFANSTQPGDRLRWTLAHELGHLFMHAVPSGNQETEADQFASEFLMPAREIALELDPVTLPRLVELKARWRVSMAALIVRARDLKVITPTKCTSWFKRISQLGYRRIEPHRIAPEAPTVLRDVLNIHQTEHGYTTEELARLTLTLEPEFVEQFLPEARGGLRVVRPS